MRKVHGSLKAEKYIIQIKLLRMTSYMKECQESFPQSWMQSENKMAVRAA
jgi:hypothetical protein